MNLAIYQDIKQVDLDAPVKPERFNGVLLTYDSGAYCFGVRLSKNGSLLATAGTVYAYFTNADGKISVDSATFTTAEASVILEKAVDLFIPGHFKLVIKVKVSTDDGDVVRTVRVIHGFVMASVDPDTLIATARAVTLYGYQSGTGKVRLYIRTTYDFPRYDIYEVTTTENGTFHSYVSSGPDTSILLSDVTTGTHKYYAMVYFTDDKYVDTAQITITVT